MTILESVPCSKFPEYGIIWIILKKIATDDPSSQHVCGEK